MSGFDAVRDAMADPGFYPHGLKTVDVRETAISLVFLAGERVYKVKKPVRLPFLDYRDPRRRRELCAEEVRLNRRLAPGIYRGVCAVVRRGERLVLGDEDDAGAVEWAVEMRRLPEERTPAALLEAGLLDAEAMRRVGRRIAAFHAEARVPDEPPGVAAVKRPIDENFQPLLDLELPPAHRGRLRAAARGGAGGAAVRFRTPGRPWWTTARSRSGGSPAACAAPPRARRCAGRWRSPAHAGRARGLGDR